MLFHCIYVCYCYNFSTSMLNGCVSKLTGAFLQEDDLGLWEEV